MSSIFKAHAELRLNPSSNWSKYDGELSQLEVMKDAILKLVETKMDGNKEKHELKAADQAKLGGRRPRGDHHQLRSPEAGALRRARSCRRRSRRRPY
jgi:hypothetical protein